MWMVFEQLVPYIRFILEHAHWRLAATVHLVLAYGRWASHVLVQRWAELELGTRSPSISFYNALT